jgi:hypothetical protein
LHRHQGDYMQPYTYVIGWANRNIWYYGAQYGKVANPENLWITYFTSSKYVKAARLLYGEPDVVEVRKVFDTANEAKNWETKVLIRLKVVEKEYWLNRTVSNGYPIRKKLEYRHSEETKRKMSESRKYPRCKLKLPYRHSEETKQKISQAHTGRSKGPCTDARKEKLRQWKGDQRHNYNHTKYRFYHKDGEIFVGTMREISEKYNLPTSNLCHMLKGRLKTVKGWKVDNA